MKILKKLISLVLNVGSGGLFGSIINIAIMAIVVISIWLGILAIWNQITYANKHYKAKAAEVENLLIERDKLRKEVDHFAFENNELHLTIGRLKTDSLTLEGRLADSEKLRKTQVEQLQSLIKDISAKSKAKDEHILNLESGLMCKTVKVGLFGKKTVTIARCDED